MTGAEDPLVVDARRVLTGWSAPSPAQDDLRGRYLAFLDEHADAAKRDLRAGHLTASAVVLDDGRERVLLTLHPLAGRWFQLGGHVEDGDGTIAAAALREATEESGINGLRIGAQPVTLHVHALTCSLGVPTRHLDIQFAAQAPADSVIAVSDESLDLRWWPVDQLPPDADPALANLVRLASQTIAERGLASRESAKNVP
jgi:8-oxo-dGTP pyrophosphatase MutT (NUDIX family)